MLSPWIPVLSLLSPQRSTGPVTPPDQNGEGPVVESLADLVPSPGFLRYGSNFGAAVVSLGDLDADGVDELAVGTPAGYETGAVLVFEDGGRTGQPHHRLGIGMGGFGGSLGERTAFGAALASLEDLDGNGVRELAVGAPYDEDGDPSVWLLFLDERAEVRREVELGAALQGSLALWDYFGSSLCLTNDFDGDGLRELVVGASHDDDGGTDCGALYVLFLRRDGSVRSHQKIGPFSGGFTGTLQPFDHFGSAVCALADLDGDGLGEIAVGAPTASFGVPAIWILFPDASGSVKKQQRIDSTSGWNVPPPPLYGIGRGLASLGDVNGDGLGDLVAGAVNANSNRGLVAHLFLNEDGEIDGYELLGTGLGGFDGDLHSGDYFGWSVAPIGDLNHDGRTDLAVGARDADDGTTNDVGELWTIEMGAGGVALASSSLGGVAGGHLEGFDYGRAIAGLGDIDGDGTTEVAVSMPGRLQSFCLWLLSVAEDGSTVRAVRPSPSTIFTSDGTFASALARAGDLDGDGIPELALGAPHARIGPGPVSRRTGALWTVFLDPDGTLRETCTTDGSSSALAFLDADDLFGAALAPLGDFDGDGILDVAVGAPGDDDGHGDAGAVYLAYLQANGSVRATAKISATSGGFGGRLSAEDAFGRSVASLGDLDGNGVSDLAVGAPGTDLPYIPSAGDVWLLFLDADGSVLAERSLRSRRNGFDVALRDGDRFGEELAAVGDVDGDGLTELAVGAPGDDDGRREAGAVWLLFLYPDGRVRRAHQISAEFGGFGEELLPLDRFGSGLGAVGDLNHDGVPDLGVGAPGVDRNGLDAGHAWTLFLR